MRKLAVFPASGSLGSSIITHLLNKINPANITLIVRHPEKIPQEYLAAGVTVRKADYNSSDTLEHVFDGVSCLFLISYPSIEHEHRLQVHKQAIDAACRSSPGVSHIFYSSLAFGGNCSPDSVAHVMQAHLATEQYLTTLVSSDTARHPLHQQKPFTFTAIREGIYSESFPMYTAFFDLKDPVDEVQIPYGGAGTGITWAKIDELGEASAQIVKEYMAAPATFSYTNQVMLLSGPKVWTLADTVKLLGKMAGKSITLKEVTIEEYVAQPLVRHNLSAHGPGDVARDWATAFEAVRRGETAVVTGELERLLGRVPEGFEETVTALANK